MARSGETLFGGDLAFLRRASAGKLLLGMVHLPPLPGSPAHAGGPLEETISRARRDAEVIVGEGMDGYLIENFGDAPFFKDRVPPHVLTSMTRIALELQGEHGGEDRPLEGVNVLRNDARGALAVAAAAGLHFIRVNVHSGAMLTDQGLIEGRAARTLRTRALLGAKVAILADVLVKHAAPLGGGPAADPAALALDLVERGGADGLIITGIATGKPADPGRLREARAAAGGRPVLVGSGVTAETVGKLLEIADGAIIGTSLKEGGDVRAPVDPQRVRALVRAARRG